MKLIIANLLVLASTLSALAEVRPEFEGKFLVAPEKMHKDSIAGTVTLFVESNDASLKKVVMKTDKPVMGKTEFESVEQVGVSLQNADGLTQLSSAFKMGGMPHKWIFVFVTNKAATDSIYGGTLYKVPSDVATVTGVLQAGVVTVPVEWKALAPIELVDLN